MDTLESSLREVLELLPDTRVVSFELNPARLTIDLRVASFLSLFVLTHAAEGANVGFRPGTRTDLRSEEMRSDPAGALLHEYMRRGSAEEVREAGELIGVFVAGALCSLGIIDAATENRYLAMWAVSGVSV